MRDALIFDSGVGGLSVSAEIRRWLPQLGLDYVCDNAALPYGTKPDAWLVARIVEVCLAACAESRPRALVIACNTASTLALEALRARLTIPVVGTVPAIKTAGEVSRSRVIGVLATSATLKRSYLQRLVADFAADCRLVGVAADTLVVAAERKLAGGELDPEALAAALMPLWREPALDTVVLGCTHFPLLRAELEAQAPRPIRWIDSGAAIARRLGQVLGVAPLAAPAATPPAATTGASWATGADATGLATALAGFGFAPPRALPTVAMVPADTAKEALHKCLRE
ncbi:glutamate racemase [Salinicola sp. JS01]|uniref:glutamate racemase n=1 Tax=Salinicola sp. JS01 TaxID=3050071 RepID=UPI00255C162E|nr:glutamate racemase [Salinicola sp. JS01]WIX31427.1 glutamate racemase [Salinicola sp. JS01]